MFDKCKETWKHQEYTDIRRLRNINSSHLFQTLCYWKIAKLKVIRKDK